MAIFTRINPPPDVVRSSGAVAEWANARGRQAYLDSEARILHDHLHGTTYADRLWRARQLTPEEAAAIEVADVAVRLAEQALQVAEVAVNRLTIPGIPRRFPRDEFGNPVIPSEVTLKAWEAEDRAAKADFVAQGPRLRVELAEAQAAVEVARFARSQAREAAAKGQRERMALVKGD
jgi:hypothetical protein